MEINVQLEFRVQPENELLPELIESCSDFCVDEELLKPQDPALMPWYDWLLDHQSDALFQPEGWELTDGRGALCFMPTQPRKFAEAMLRLLQAIGAAYPVP